MSGPLARIAGLFVAPAATVASVPRIEAARGGGRVYTAPVAGWQPPAEGHGPSASAADASGSDTDGSDRVSTWDTGAVSDDRPSVIHAAVFGAGTDAVALGAALAGELRARVRGRAAVLMVWDPSRESPAPMPAWPGARTVAAALSAGAPAVARGRLVQVELPHDPVVAAAVAARLAGRGGVPTVMVLAGPRPPAFDDLLTSRDVLVVMEGSGAPAALTALAAVELRRLNPRVRVEAPIAGAGRRLLALAGLARARHFGPSIDAAMP
jgi:hypothetical protein